MPSPNKRICIFGDSHFACVRIAVRDKLVDSKGFDVEFWGNIGKQFRHLAWRNEQIEPLDEFTAGRFAATNEKGRRVLNAADFDSILFMGCRVDLYKLFPEALHRRMIPEKTLSADVERRWIADFLRRQPPYHFAKKFAQQSKAKVLLAPVSFDTDDFEETIPEHFATARLAKAENRAAIWRVAASVLEEDGIDLLPQPEETVVNGCCTDPAFAVQRYRERNDRTHKNPQYGALILSRALERLSND